MNANSPSFRLSRLARAFILKGIVVLLSERHRNEKENVCKDPKTLHHRGYADFMVACPTIQVPSKMK